MTEKIKVPKKIIVRDPDWGPATFPIDLRDARVRVPIRVILEESLLFARRSPEETLADWWQGSPWDGALINLIGGLSVPWPVKVIFSPVNGGKSTTLGKPLFTHDRFVQMISDIAKEVGHPFANFSMLDKFQTVTRLCFRTDLAYDMGLCQALVSSQVARDDGEIPHFIPNPAVIEDLSSTVSLRNAVSVCVRGAVKGSEFHIFIPPSVEDLIAGHERSGFDLGADYCAKLYNLASILVADCGFQRTETYSEWMDPKAKAGG